MNTKRKIIESLRNKIRELNADSNYSNQFLYQSILEQASWLISREASTGGIWVNTALFQSYTVKMIEVSLIDSCLPISSGCKIFRSKERLPNLWLDKSGPMLRSVSSVDGSTHFFYTTSIVWSNKRKDPYKNKAQTKNCFFEDGYLWIPEHNPHYVSVLGYFEDDLSLATQNCTDCDNKDCVRFLDTSFNVPPKLVAEILSKALQLLVGISRTIPEDLQINKNSTKR